MVQVIPFEAGKSLDDIMLLSKSSFLARLDPRDLGALMDALDQVALPEGATVITQGDEGDWMYFVLDGRVVLRRGEIDVAKLGRGDYFGETAILGVRLRSFSATAETVVRLARLSRARFLSFSTKHPRAALRLLEALAVSLAQTVTGMADDVGLLQQRSLPRRSNVRVRLGPSVVDVATGTPVGTLLPRVHDGALVVAAAIDHKPASLGTPITSNAVVDPMTVASWEGRRIFRTSVLLLVLEAARLAFPTIRFAVGGRRADGQLIRSSSGLLAADVERIAERTQALLARGERLAEELWTVDEALGRFLEQGWSEAAALLPFHREKTVALFRIGGTFAIAHGPIVEEPRMLEGFSLHAHEEGLRVDFGVALRPHASLQSTTASIADSRSTVMTREREHWLEALGVVSVGDFDRSCVTGQVDELVRVSEGFHEKHIGRIADQIANDTKTRIVGIAGPSSSGKTTFIRRLKVQLEVDGITPVHLSLDDYYVDRDKTPHDENGELDYETTDALDLALLSSHVSRLLAGERVRTARYDFLAGRSLPEGGRELVLAPSTILLVEGLHALSPRIGEALGAEDRTLRVFVHPAMALPLDRLSVVLPEDVRLLRRIVRDRHGRGSSASDSIRRWPSVRRGEERHVFTCLPHADFVFDSSLVYELAVLRVYAERYLLEIDERDPAYATAYRLRQLVDRFVPIHPDHVPPTSILREFIGGSGFDAQSGG